MEEKHIPLVLLLAAIILSMLMYATTISVRQHSGRNLENPIPETINFKTEEEKKKEYLRERLEAVGFVKIKSLPKEYEIYKTDLMDHTNIYIKNEKDPYIKSFYSSKTSFCMSEPNLSVGLCVHDISLRTIKRENNKITFILREYETYLGEYFFTVEYISPNEVYVVKEIKNDSRLGFYERNQRRRIENNEIIQEAMSYIK